MRHCSEYPQNLFSCRSKKKIPEFLFVVKNILQQAMADELFMIICSLVILVENSA